MVVNWATKSAVCWILYNAWNFNCSLFRLRCTVQSMDALCVRVCVCVFAARTVCIVSILLYSVERVHAQAVCNAYRMLVRVCVCVCMRLAARIDRSRRRVQYIFFYKCTNREQEKKGIIFKLSVQFIGQHSQICTTIDLWLWVGRTAAHTTRLHTTWRRATAVLTFSKQ